jgi:hypothetical protein
MKRIILFALGALVLAGCSELRPAPSPSGSPNDGLYKQQRAKRQNYSETEAINACSESSGSCYSLVADLEHEFDEHGTEVVYVQRIHFPNGGYLDFGGATIPGGGTDTKERAWSFAW